MKLTQKQVQHLLLRSGFGSDLKTVNDYIGLTPEQVFETVLKKSEVSTEIKTDMPKVDLMKIKGMSAKQRKALKEKAREALIELNTRWIKEMVSSDGQLREKMAFFWHDHFACTSSNPLFLQSYLSILRSNAIGNFGMLLKEISKTPAMLQYLNNQQNKKTSPNENFAREVMELFTLGRDNGYTEKDISEAARAFTGWGFNKDGNFVFRKFFHDFGEKSVLGRSDNLDGDDVIDILLSQKQTAKYISEKWVRFFVNYEGNQELERRVADELFRTNYDISSALKVLFTSSEFYDSKNLARRIKSPIELLVGMQRQLHLEITNDESLIYLQRTLGQMLFKPPNVAGWNDGKDWVDSATLMFRVNLPQLVFRSGLIDADAVSYDDNDAFNLRGKLKKLETALDTAAMNESFSNLSFKDLSQFIIQPKFESETSNEGFIDQIIFLTSKPEYQLC